jgi:3-isopropylmalate/(R)-2-methylmalate dehydratase small subunit
MAKVILKLEDDVSTDIIYPGRYMATVLPGETPQYAFADLPVNQRLRRGEIPVESIVVAGKNFACGSSREQAASCLKGWELRIIAPGFARIFMQNAVNLGLELIICPEIEAEEGDELEVTGGEVINLTKGRRFKISPLPEARQRIIDAGGLIPYTRQILLTNRNNPA